MYSLCERVSPRELRPLKSGWVGFVPVHQESQAVMPGLIHDVAARSEGVASVAMS